MRERIERRRRERREFMVRLYQRTEASVSEFVPAYDLAADLGIERDELRRHLDYLAEKGWIMIDDHRGGIVRITARGIDRVERARGG